jgi:hypothetical protein
MKKTINQYDFVKAFDDYDRSENFSRQGREALFDYLEMLEEDTESEIELDVIAICCEYTEYENFEELQKDYNVEDMNELEQNTTVIKIDDESFIIQSY